MVKQIPNKILVLGGAASGKSAFAEGLLDGVTPRVYIATAQAFDTEMTDKIAEHKTRRGGDWHTIESPRGLAKAIENAPPNAPQGGILVDCMTMWLANIMGADMDTEMNTEITALLHVFETSEKRLILVSNETGLGIVPDSPLARRFRQSQGELNQALAARADCVIQVIAGLPLILKGQI